MIKYSLSQAQRRIWFAQKKHPDSPLFIVGGSVRVQGDLSVPALEQALWDVYRRNMALRMRFSETNGEPYQYTEEESRPLVIDFVDFSEKSNPEKAYRVWCQKQARTIFSLTAEVLCSFSIFKISSNDTGFYIRLHHLVSDGWSVQLITNQIAEAYEKRTESAMNVCSFPSYLAVVEAEEKEIFSKRLMQHKTFWNEMTQHLEDLPERETSYSLKATRMTFQLDKSMSGKIKEFTLRHSISLNTFIIGIYILYVLKTTKKKYVTLGLPLLGRSSRTERETCGTFTNTMPFYFEATRDVDVLTMFSDLSQRLWECCVHQKYPYNWLLRDVQAVRHSVDSLFRVCVNTYNTTICRRIGGMQAVNTEFFNGEQLHELQIIVREWEPGMIQLDFDFRKDVYGSVEVKRIYCFFCRIIRQIIDDPGLKIKNIVLLSPRENRKWLYDYNKTESPFPQQNLLDIFDSISLCTPEKRAVSMGTEYLSYRQLHSLSGRLAEGLSSRGIQKGSIVAAALSHQIQSIAAVLAILKCGAVYLPIDPASPENRISGILEDAGAEHFLTNVSLEPPLYFSGTVHVLEEIKMPEKEKPTSRISPDDLAYLIYTSGSTGNPKGVMIRHRGLMNYLWWAKSAYVKLPNEVFALYSSFAFDFTVTSLFLPLISGGEIRIYPNQREENIFSEILADKGATILKITPSHIPLICSSEIAGSRIHTLILGGEDLKAAGCRALYKRIGEEIRIFNEYGPTEATVGCMTYQYSPRRDEEESVPIGRPIYNTQIYLLDSDRNPVPDETEGEIYIGGAGVAAGYTSRDFSSFLPNPYRPGEYMYKTGDMARRHKDGNLVFIGRNDRQIKLRGNRVELGEIEACVLKSGMATDAYLQEASVSECMQLIAYLIPNDTYDEKKLRSFLGGTLPHYMLPRYFIPIRSFPLTGNGKLDPAGLPLPVTSAPKNAIRENSEKEKVLFKALDKVFPGKKLSVTDDFYAVGGDSIKAIQISSYLAGEQYEINVSDILENPVLGEMASRLHGKTQRYPQGIAAGILCGTPVLKRFLNQKLTQPGKYNQSVLLHLKKHWSGKKLGDIFQKLVCHHDALRLNLYEDGQTLFYNNRHCTETMVPISKYVDSLEEFKALNHIFQLREELLFVPYLAEFEGEQYLLLIAHHLVIDGVSWRILLEDLASCMQMADQDLQLQLPPKTASYLQYAEEISKLRESCSHEALLPRLSQSAESVSELRNMENVCLILDTDTSSKLLNEANKAFQTKPEELLLTAVYFALQESLGKDILVEMESHGRDLTPFLCLERTIGWFTQFYLCRLHVEVGETQKRIRSLKEQIRTAKETRRYGRRSTTEFDCTGKIRFNYLGEFQDYGGDYFNIVPQFLQEQGMEEELSCVQFVFNILVYQEQIYLYITCDGACKSILKERLLEEIQSLLRLCLAYGKNQPTPVEYPLVNLTTEELEEILSDQGGLC